jgi:hypothetical protein
MCALCSTHLKLINFTKSKSHCDRRSVDQSAFVSSHLWGQDQIFVTVRQLRVCRYEEPSLTRRRVCHLSPSCVSSTWYLYSQFYLSAFNTVICQKSSDFLAYKLYIFYPVLYKILFTVLHAILAAILLHEF